MEPEIVRTSYLDGFTRYPVSVIGHHAQGVVAAHAVLTGVPALMAAAAIWAGLYVAYQALTRLRKGDSAGLDVADFIVGFGLGLAGNAVLA